MRICADSSFLIALYDETDDYHIRATRCFETYVERGPHALLMPWPVLYESISTRMARVGRRMEKINTHFKTLRTNNKLNFLDDTLYREKALEKAFPEGRSNRQYRALSLVDRVIREILSTRAIQIHALATFNTSDFRDVCRDFRKKLLPDPD